jgi:hypothetical protein
MPAIRICKLCEWSPEEAAEQKSAPPRSSSASYQVSNGAKRMLAGVECHGVPVSTSTAAT